MENNERWICALCGKHWPVTILARECEAKHLADVEDVSETSGTVQSR